MSTAEAKPVVIPAEKEPETRELARQTSQEMQQYEPAPVAPGQLTMIDVIDRALQSGRIGPENLDKLLDAQERMMKMEAERKFNEAFSQFSADRPIIYKDKHVFFEAKDKEGDGQKRRPIEYDHATLGQVSTIIGERLGKYGLSHHWVPGQDEKTQHIIVTCVIGGFGHSISCTMRGGADSSGNKNPLQMIGSTKSYLERYTLLSLSGCSAEESGDDDGAAGSSSEAMAETQKRFPRKGKIKPGTNANRDHGAENLEQGDLLQRSEDGKHSARRFGKEIVPQHKNCTDCNKLVMLAHKRQEEPQPTEKEKLMARQQEILRKIWPGENDSKSRAIAAKAAFRIDTRSELENLPIEALRAGVAALEAFLSDVEGGYVPSISPEGLTADVESCAKEAAQKKAPAKRGKG